GAVDWVGKALPDFPLQEFQGIGTVNFYLEEGGTINITAMNSSRGSKTFNYVIKDTKLGYAIAEVFDSQVSSAVVHVPKNRNYSIMIFPSESLPVSYEWNNFSSDSSYNFNYESSYNHTTNTIHKKFNCSETFVRITGYLKNSTGSIITNLDEFTIVPFILEPGNMIFLDDSAAMPYNMSSWASPWGTQSDYYNLTSGFYNITLPNPSESVSYLLFASAKKGSGYYGSYYNLSISGAEEINLTAYPLMSTNWGSPTSNITMRDARNWTNTINISSAKQQFNLVNKTDNQTISNVNAHIEFTVDYTEYGSTEFTFMIDLQAGNFYVPLLNASIKEINIYTQNFASKRIGGRTASQLNANSNISMDLFNKDMESMDTVIQQSSLVVQMLKSNSNCSIPYPNHTLCSLTNSSMNNFNPLSAVIGGGKLDFAIKYNQIEVRYINVDLLASGPPEALFDAESDNTTSENSFSEALRFGSGGPTIYEYILISMPYTEGSSSQTGLNESDDINMSIPYFYDENWDIIWNVSANGTEGNSLGGNESHYYEKRDEWGTLMSGINCSPETINNSANLNATNPCYIDKTNNKIWLRLPHFSGTNPTISGRIISSTSSSEESEESDDSGGGSSGSTSSSASNVAYTPAFWKMTYVVKDIQFKHGYKRELKEKERAKIKVGSSYHHIGIADLDDDKIVVNVSSDPQSKEMEEGDIWKVDADGDDYYDLSVEVLKINNNNASLNILKINGTVVKVFEEINGSVNDTIETVATTANESAKTTSEESESQGSLGGFWWWIFGVFAILIIASLAVAYYVWQTGRNDDEDEKERTLMGRIKKLKDMKKENKKK
ncbi:MAG: hypothetical protein ACOCUT_02755, partial [bacterium]